MRMSGGNQEPYNSDIDARRSMKTDCLVLLKVTSRQMTDVKFRSIAFFAAHSTCINQWSYTQSNFIDRLLKSEPKGAKFIDFSCCRSNAEVHQQKHFVDFSQ
jgi:hypothetical protein